MRMVKNQLSLPRSIFLSGEPSEGSSHPSEEGQLRQPDWSAVAAKFALPDFVGPWVVLHTRSRQEKALAEDLNTLGVPYFLPLLTAIRFYNGRKARVRVPMFPSYLFIRGEMEQAYQAEKTRRVVSIIKVSDPRRLSWELRNLALALSGDVTLDPFPGIVQGVRVEVVTGPFMGLQGVVVDRSHMDRVHLQVSMLGGGAALELDASVMKVVD